MRCNSAQTELVVMATQYMTNQERTGMRYKHVAFVGDGSNDFCPALRLSEKDYICPRESYRLWKKIKKMESDPEIKGEHEIKARLVNWSSGFDILDFLKSRLLKCRCTCIE